MLKSLKTSLVKSYVGAIGTGWVFGQGLVNFTAILGAPISYWLDKNAQLRQSPEAAYFPIAPAPFSWQPALPNIFWSLLYFTVTFVLLRWLYYSPVDEKEDELIDNAASKEYTGTGISLR